MKVEVKIPNGKYCTGCPLSIGVWMHQMGQIHYGCNYLHTQCEPHGEYDNRAKKHPKCPSLRKPIKLLHKTGTIPIKDIKQAVRQA